MSRRKGAYLYAYVAQYSEFQKDPPSEARSNRYTLVVRVKEIEIGYAIVILRRRPGTTTRAIQAMPT